MLARIPVFIGMYQVLWSFNRSAYGPIGRAVSRPLSVEQNHLIGNYVFSAADVRSSLDAHLFGVPLLVYITELPELLARYGDISRWQIALVAIPLTIIAGVLARLTAKHSVQRRNLTQAANSQAANSQAANSQAVITNRFMVYLFPLGLVVIGPFLSFAILLYWLRNNLWTLVQQRVVYQRVDAENMVTQTPRQRTSHPPEQPANGQSARTMRGGTSTGVRIKT